MKRTLVVIGAVVLFVVAVLAVVRPSLSKLQSEADSLAGVYTRDTAAYAADTLATNAADSVKLTTRQAVVKERASCVRAIRTCEARTKNYQQQIKALTPTLRVFAEVDYGVPLDRAVLGTVLGGTISARAGLALRLKQDFDAQVFVQKPLLGDGQSSLNLGIRKSWRLL